MCLLYCGFGRGIWIFVIITIPSFLLMKTAQFTLPGSPQAWELHTCREFVAITMTELLSETVAVFKMLISDFLLTLPHHYLLCEQSSDMSFCCWYVLKKTHPAIGKACWWRQSKGRSVHMWIREQRVKWRLRNGETFHSCWSISGECADEVSIANWRCTQPLLSPIILTWLNWSLL